MTSKQKAKQFLEVSSIAKHTSSQIGYALIYLIARAENGGSPLANDLRDLKEEYQDELEGVLDITVEVVSEVFTDDELDELIVLHSNPTLDKLRGLTPEIIQRVLEKFSKQSDGARA
jgi:hypothetical protein